MTDSFEESLNSSLSFTSRARQLLVDIGLKEPDWNPPPGHAEYDALVVFVADHLRQVAAEARDALKAELEVSEAVNKTKTLSLASLRDLLVEAGEALKWYADEGPEKFRIVDSTGSVIAKFADFGDRARAALARLASLQPEVAKREDA